VRELCRQGAAKHVQIVQLDTREPKKISTPLGIGASHNLARLWLDDAELTEFLRELVTVVQPRLANAPKPGRKRRILATVLLPGGEPSGS
jgi:hypothetical protein